MTITVPTRPDVTWRSRFTAARKRLDRSGLRWQARLEGIRFDRYAPWSVMAVFWVVLAGLALARSRELGQDASLAGPMQAVWLIGEGFLPDASVVGHNVLWEQGSFLLYPVALLASLLPTATTLLVIQSGALALGVVPLWRLARRVANLRIGATMVVAFAYCCYSAIHAVNLAGFHIEVVALPALIAAVLAGKEGRPWAYWACVAVIVTARADLALVVAGLGILWLIEGRRRLAWTSAVVGLGYFLVLLLVVQPLYADGAYPHLDAFAAYGEGNPFSIAWGLLTSPVQLARDLLSDQNFRTFVTLLAPVLFLPVVAFRHLLPVLPIWVLYSAADVPEGTLLEAQQWIPLTALVFVATVFALAKIGRILVQRVNIDRRVIAALSFTAAVFFVRDAPTSPYQDPWAWGRRSETDLLRLDAVSRIPDDAVVRASPRLLPLLTERPGLFLLDTSQPYDDTTTPQAATARVNYVIFDAADATNWAPVDVVQFESALINRQKFRKIYGGDDDPIRVYRLPASSLGG